MTNHQEFIRDKWHKMTLAQQLGNVGSDFERALKWKEKNHEKLFKNAAYRTLEQLDMTLTDKKLLGHRRQEIARVRESVCTELFSTDGTPASSTSLARYFLSMATLARRAQN